MRNQLFYIYIWKYFLYLKNSRSESSKNFNKLFIAKTCFRFSLKNCAMSQDGNTFDGKLAQQDELPGCHDKLREAKVDMLSC